MNAGTLGYAGVGLAVGAAIVAGLVISGSPAEQRRLREDDARVADLRRLSRSIERYYRDTERLPESLPVLLNGWASTAIPQDPVTDAAYAYTIDGPRRYRLCAEFALESDADGQAEFWAHDAGRHCFAFDYSDFVLD